MFMIANSVSAVSRTGRGMERSHSRGPRKAEAGSEEDTTLAADLLLLLPEGSPREDGCCCKWMERTIH